MASKIDWNNQIGRRLKLRDLHVFVAVSQHGSMARAAAHLGVSQPAVSEVIAGLENTVNAQLLERSPQGVELTIFGHVLLQRSLAAFDELRQGIHELEFLSDPTAGDLRVGCVESISSALLLPLFQTFSKRYPKVMLNVDPLVTPTLELPRLRDRSLDVVVARLGHRAPSDEEDLEVEVLFHDHLVLVAGMNNPLARRRKITAADLADQPWTLLPPGTWNNRIITEFFRDNNVPFPKASISSFSFHLRANLVITGSFLTGLPISSVRYSARSYPLKVLPVVNWPILPWAVGIVTLKKRKLSPVARLFIEELRAYTATLTADLKTTQMQPA